MDNRRPNQPLRWAIFVLVLFGFAAFIQTQPTQNQNTLFLLVIPLSLVLGMILLVQQPGGVGTAVDAEPRADERWKKVLILAVALVMMFVGQLQIFRDPSGGSPGASYMLILVGLALFLVITNGTVPDDGPAAVPQAVPVLHVHWVWMAISVGLAAFAAWRNSQQPPQAYLGEYIVVLGLSVVCFINAVRLSKKTPPPPDTNPLDRSEYLLLIGLFVAALLIRGINIDTVPRVFDNDEGNISVTGVDIHSANFLTAPFSVAYLDLPVMSSLLIGVSTALFGQTAGAARLPSVLWGALTIPAIYLLGRELFGRRIGLIAALFSLGWAIEVQMSRLALNQAGDILFGTLTFYFLVKGLRRGRAIDYVLCGLCLAWSQLFFVMGRQVPLVLVAYLVYLALRQRELLRRQWRLLLLVPAMAFVMLLPQNYHMLVNHEALFEHTETNIVWGGQLGKNEAAGNLVPYLTHQFQASFLSLFSTHDWAVYYGPGSNYMGPVGGPPLLIGVVVSLLVLWKRPQWSLPLGWGISTLLIGGVLATNPPQYQRLAAGAPAFALLVGLGVETIGCAFADIFRDRRLLARAAVGIGTVLCAANLAFYVGVFVPEGRDLVTLTNWGANRAAADIVANAHAGREVVMIAGGTLGVTHYSPELDYLTKGLPFIDNEDVSQLDAQLANFDPQKPFFIMATPDHKDRLDALAARYPGGTLDAVHLDENGSLAYYTYTRGAVQAKSTS